MNAPLAISTSVTRVDLSDPRVFERVEGFVRLRSDLPVN